MDQALSDVEAKVQEVDKPPAKQPRKKREGFLGKQLLVRIELPLNDSDKERASQTFLTKVRKADVALIKARKLNMTEKPIAELNRDQKRKQRQTMNLPVPDDLKSWLATNSRRLLKNSLPGCDQWIPSSATHAGYKASPSGLLGLQASAFALNAAKECDQKHGKTHR